MVARQIGEFAVVDEHGRTAVFRHQRVGQRQRRMRDVGAADVESPGHCVRIRQHQRIDAELCNFQPDTLQFLGFDLAGKLRTVNSDRAERRGGALGPYGIKRVGVDRDQFGTGLGTGRRQPLGCRRSMQPGVKTEAVVGGEMLGQPVFRRRVGQRLDMPGLAVDLLGGLQRVAAVHEHNGLLGQDHRHAGRAGEAGEPRQPLFRRRDIFILLLIGARNHESRQLAPRQLLTEGGQSRGQRHAAFGLFECLEMGFEHHVNILELSGKFRNASQILSMRPEVCLNCCTCVRRGLEQIAIKRRLIQRSGGNPGVFQLNEEGIHNACFHVRERFRRRSAAARFLRSPRSNAVLSSRSWTGSSKHASSAASKRREGRDRPQQPPPSISHQARVAQQEAAPAFECADDAPGPAHAHDRRQSRKPPEASAAQIE